MGLLKWIIILGIIGFVIWAILPTGTLGGSPSYDVEISATVSHGIVNLPQSFDISNVNHKINGVSKNLDLGGLFGIGTYTAYFKFCIDSSCQWESVELSQFTFGESKTASETVSHVEKGTHNLFVGFYTDNTLRDSYEEDITV